MALYTRSGRSKDGIDEPKGFISGKERAVSQSLSLGRQAVARTL